MEDWAMVYQAWSKKMPPITIDRENFCLQYDKHFLEHREPQLLVANAPFTAFELYDMGRPCLKFAGDVWVIDCFYRVRYWVIGRRLTHSTKILIMEVHYLEALWDQYVDYKTSLSRGQT